MPNLKPPPVVVIGDIVGSRGASDRTGLHRRLDELLRDANERWHCDLRITVGDEFQGTVTTLGAATALSLHLRVALLPEHDVRHGIGRGTTTVLDARERIEDGPGWWAAREAIDTVKADARRAATRAARTGFQAAEDAVHPGDAAIDAALLARDELVGRLDERSLSVLRGLLAGRTQRELADELGVSASAVSQRVRHDGLGVVVAMSHRLEGLT